MMRTPSHYLGFWDSKLAARDRKESVLLGKPETVVVADNPKEPNIPVVLITNGVGAIWF